MKKSLDTLTANRLDIARAARLRGGIVGGSEADPGIPPDGKKRQNRIVGGEDADINEYPWQP